MIFQNDYEEGWTIQVNNTTDQQSREAEGHQSNRANRTTSQQNNMLTDQQVTETTAHEVKNLTDIDTDKSTVL